MRAREMAMAHAGDDHPSPSCMAILPPRLFTGASGRNLTGWQDRAPRVAALKNRNEQCRPGQNWLPGHWQARKPGRAVYKKRASQGNGET
jgi:hypothetical protein